MDRKILKIGICEDEAVQALHFLIKPVRKEKLDKVLETAVKALPQKEETVLFTREGEAELIPVRDILYAEAFSHSMRLRLMENGEPVSRDMKIGLKETEAQLLEKGFFRCHRSYLVNLAHVKKIVKTACRKTVRLSAGTDGKLMRRAQLTDISRLRLIMIFLSMRFRRKLWQIEK